ncbi:MAG: hypothetical protein EXR54_09295 [Dehalococcoidia bacterium]|nr:hypothetical protein [Dehalococcoidia bacterium]
MSVDSASLTLGERVTAWAGDDASRWKKIHGNLLGAYGPAWPLVEARCTVVGWAAAWVAITKAQQELARLENLRSFTARLLTRAQQASMAARKVDILFWGRVARHFAQQVPAALSRDRESARIVARLVGGAGE